MKNKYMDFIAFMMLTLLCPARSDAASPAGPLVSVEPVYAMDDSITISWYPYMTFVQPNDSSLVQIYFGELSVHRPPSGFAPRPIFFKPYNDGDLYMHWDTPDNQADSSRYAWFVASAGDTVSYYLNLYITPRNGTASRDYGISDTVMLIVQLKDSTTASVYNIDTIGVGNVHNPDSLFVRIIPGISTGWRHGIYAIPSDLAGHKVAIQVLSRFIGNQANDLLCRKDLLSIEILSESSQAYYAALQPVIDSAMHAMGLLPKRGVIKANSSDSDFTFTIQPNPAKNWCTISWHSVIPSSSASFCVFDLSGGLVQRITIPSSPGYHSIKTDLESLPTGAYWIVPVVGMQFLVGQQISIVK